MESGSFGYDVDSIVLKFLSIEDILSLSQVSKSWFNSCTKYVKTHHQKVKLPEYRSEMSRIYRENKNNDEIIKFHYDHFYSQYCPLNILPAFSCSCFIIDHILEETQLEMISKFSMSPYSVAITESFHCDVAKFVKTFEDAEFVLMDQYTNSDEDKRKNNEAMLLLRNQVITSTVPMNMDNGNILLKQLMHGERTVKKICFYSPKSPESSWKRSSWQSSKFKMTADNGVVYRLTSKCNEICITDVTEHDSESDSDSDDSYDDNYSDDEVDHNESVSV